MLSVSFLVIPAVVAGPADVPAPNTASWAVSKTQRAKDDLLNSKKCKVLFVGDSITESWLKEGAQIWNRVFKPMDSVNFGVSGDTTNNVLWRCDDTKLATKETPKACVLMIGTNNIESNTATEIVAGVKAVAERLLARYPETSLYIMNILPYGSDPVADLRKKGDQANEGINALTLYEK